MHFPISGVDVNPVLLALVGMVIGVLGGFFGVGGGFLAGPLMFWLGVPMNYVVGTDLAHMTGKSLVAAKQHRALGHVDIKLAALMVVGTLIGVECGARLVELLERLGSIDIVLGTAYVAILLGISGFMGYDSIRALRRPPPRDDGVRTSDVAANHGIAARARALRIPPMISLPASGIKEISLWAILGVGLMTGLFSGALGVGGGFVRMPALVYGLGVSTHVAIGTDLFEIVVSAGYGTITHAVKGNVDVLMALVMQTGAAIGAKMGALMTRRFSGPKIRLAFSAMPLFAAAVVLIRLIGAGGPH
ncbi:MAG: sulfite exporter TauE/SafE family protein [Armatimonadota bacterium]